MRLLKYKKEVDAEYESEKWGRIAEKTENDDGVAMTTAEVRRRYLTIEKNGFQDGGESEDETGDGDDGGLQDTTGMDEIDRELAGIGDSHVEGTSDLDAEIEDTKSDFGDGQRALALADGDSGGLTQAQIEALAKHAGRSGLGNADEDDEGLFFQGGSGGKRTLGGQEGLGAEQEDGKESMDGSDEGGEGARGEAKKSPDWY